MGIDIKKKYYLILMVKICTLGIDNQEEFFFLLVFLFIIKILKNFLKPLFLSAALFSTSPVFGELNIEENDIGSSSSVFESPQVERIFYIVRLASVSINLDVEVFEDGEDIVMKCLPSLDVYEEEFISYTGELSAVSYGTIGDISKALIFVIPLFMDCNSIKLLGDELICTIS